MYPALRALRRIEYESQAEILERQRRKLAAALTYAKSHVPLYDSLDPSVARDPFEAILAFPFLTKSHLQAHYDLLQARPAPRRIHSKTTGGSTGQPVTVLKDATAIAAERAATWLAYGWFGVKVADRGARFWGSPTDVGKRWLRFALADVAMNRIRLTAFGVTDERLSEYWRRCMSFRPRYLYGYVSMLERFARFIRDNGVDGTTLGVRSVITTSEELTTPQRQLLTTVFDAPVQNEYGCGEMGPIAYECEEGSLHIMSENVFVELVDGEGQRVSIGEEGSVVVTDLNNKAMPLVRYRLEDRAVRGDSCSCGRGFPVLGSIRGREYDFVTALDGRSFHGEFFMYLFEDLRDSGLSIKNFRIVQTAADALKIDVEASQADSVPIRDFVRRAIAKELDIVPDVHVMETLPLTPSGKLRVIENHTLTGRSG
jgi:phenylacetate-CoA ligase